MPGTPHRRDVAHRLWHRAACLLGRRGAFLVLLGLVWVLVGIGLVGVPPNTNPGAEHLLHERLPNPVRVGLWVGTGMVACWYGTRRGPGKDSPGYVAIVLMPAERAASFMWGFLVWLWPWADGGYPRGFIQSLQWVAVIFAVQIVAGWREQGGAEPPHGHG